jgi:uncharacterized Zn finger protein (UPF0148 family)
MRLFEFHCKRCESYVDSAEPVVICPNCQSEEITVTYYEEMTIRRLVRRMADIEAELKRIIALIDEDDHEATDH